ncbi:MAG: hypothetical protein AAGH81_02720 [Bacteroidota bacterium]
MLHIILLTLCLPVLGISQIEKAQASFYLELGRKDATHELSLTNLNPEDEKDFWLDQKRFEALLKQESPVGYQTYINGKYEVYRAHQILCGDGCDYSEVFATQSAFYLINGESIGTTEVVLETKRPKGKNN